MFYIYLNGLIAALYNSREKGNFKISIGYYMISTVNNTFEFFKWKEFSIIEH